VREQSDLPTRHLVVMRHGKAEPGGETDHARALAQRGWNDAVEAGRWLADRGLVVDGALVSSARRTTSTWLAIADGGSFDVEPNFGAFSGFFKNHEYTNLGVNLNYDIGHGVTLYGNLRNALNQHYEETYGFPSLRLNFVAGLKWRLSREP